jgi:hypothetical protein
MKTRVHWTWCLGLVLAALPLARHQAQEAPSESGTAAPAVAQQGATEPNLLAVQTNTAAVQGAETNLADAAFQPISTAKPVPPQVKPTQAVAEVIRLAESGVEEGVILTYVTNSATAFNLNPDGIIYLNDIGVPGSVVSAMIQRDQALKGLPANNAVPAPPPAVASDPYAPVPEMPLPEAAPVPTAPPDEMASDTTPPADYGPADESLQPPDNGSYSTFYDALAPYGTWVDVAGYGPCWQPTVVVANPYWQPYFNCGHWVYTDCGWYWLSGYSWGWAPFHYGRWFNHHRLGWCWAPDRTWGPSWVCWRYGATHCAWAPLPPGAWYRPGTGLTYRGRQVPSTFSFGLATRSFAVVPFNHFWDHRLTRYAVPRQQANQVLKGTVSSASVLGSNNRIINNGLPPARVSTATGTSIHRVAVHDSYAPTVHGVRAERVEASGTSLSVFRPTLAPHAAAQSATAGTWMNQNSKTVPAETTLSGALIMRGSRQGTPGQISGYSGPRDVPQSAAGSRNTFGTAYSQQRLQTQRGAEVSEFPRPASPAWSAPQTAVPERYGSAPSSHPPEMPRGAPAYTPPQHEYAAPAPSYTPRSEPVQSHPTYSPPPPAPAPSAPPAYSRGSSDRPGR